MGANKARRIASASEVTLKEGHEEQADWQAGQGRTLTIPLLLVVVVATKHLCGNYHIPGTILNTC